MSTSTSTIKQNVKTTPKTREPSKERIKTKKDEAQAKIGTNTKTTKAAIPSSNRLLKNGKTSTNKLKKQVITSPASIRLKRSEEVTGNKLKTSTSISNSGGGLKKTEEDSARKLKTSTLTTKTTKDESARSKISPSSRLKNENPSKVFNGKGTGKVMVSSRKPGSPTSRIKKSQFIPNTKEMYSNALKNASKESNSENSSACSTLERPRTATLRKGSIVNMNIAGPDVPKTGVESVKKKSSPHTPKEIVDTIGKEEEDKKTSSDVTDRMSGLNSKAAIKAGIDDFLRSKTPNSEEYDYEEDFDSYASDFDEYQSSSETSNCTINTSSESSDVSTSSSTSGGETKPRINSAEEERKLDSGNFDLPETKHKPILGNITEHKEIMTHGSLSDEGFEEIKSLQFVNFLGAKKKRELQRCQSRRNKRGEELLGMIRLDQRNFTLIDIPAVSYDTYIKSFGNRNSTQVASQTHDDDVSEETQTEEITKDNKWTQYPIKYSKINSVEDLMSMNHKGVGSDNPEDNRYQTPKYNEYNLDVFLRNSGQVVLALLQENEGLKTNTKLELTQNTDASNLSFCDSGVCLSSDFLKPRSVSYLGFSTGGLLKLVSVHPPVGEGNKDCVLGDDFRLKSVGCVWDPSDVTLPEDVFAGFGTVNAACFAATNNKLVFGGLNDGTVTLWDLLEGRTEGGNYLELDWRNSRREVRMTSTAKCTTAPDLETGSARIVAIHSIADNFGNSHKDRDVLATNLQVLTLNEIGDLTIWGLITHGTHKEASLVRYSAFSLGTMNPELTDLQCTDMCVDKTDANHVYVATNYGYTLHCLVNGSKTNPKKYSPESTCRANSIEPCYHQKDCFLVGFEDGNVSLYSNSVEKPLASFTNQDEEETPLKTVQWSRNRPWIFYTTDSDRTIHIWDLSHSEHFPEHSVPFANGVKSIKLSEPSNINNKRSYLAIIAKDEYIHLHQLTGDHSRKSAEDYSKDLKVFTNYINRL